MAAASEAIVAASWLDTDAAAGVVLESMKQPYDTWMGPVTKSIVDHTLKDNMANLRGSPALNLESNANARAFFAGEFKFPEAPKSEAQRNYGPTRTLEGEDRRMYNIGKEVYLRDAHCATCHQANGEGLANIYPPLAKTEWVEDEERLIKLVLRGIWGPIVVNGQTYDPSKGVPPMMGFAPMLNDIELAAVLTYVRQSFGNDHPPVAVESVRRIRAATQDRVNHYTVEELLREHPLKPAAAP